MKQSDSCKIYNKLCNTSRSDTEFYALKQCIEEEMKK